MFSFMKVFVFFTALNLLFSVNLSSKAYASETDSCYATLENNILTIGNSKIRRSFQFNDGELKSTSIFDVSTGSELINKNRLPDIRIAKLTGKPESAKWSKKVVKNSVTPAHLQVEVTTSFEKIDIRRVFRIYPDCPVIGGDFYLRAKDENLPGFRPADTILQELRPKGNHWNFRAVEFFDRTDSLNTMVRETSTLAFVRGTQLQGNILFCQNPLSESAFFMIKEAPCSFVQLHYPGYDFVVSNRSISAAGMGITADDLAKDEWIRVYGLALGVCRNSETEFQKSLRHYQKKLRRNIPERDDMIMMNTWGDRNRDANIGEEFAKKEIDACARLGVTHFQLDDGWQQGLSMNSAVKGSRLWDMWELENWKPHAERFPNGLKPVVEYAREKGVRLGLWFHPSNENDYKYWERDAKIVTDLYSEYGISYIKIDGIKLPTKKADVNLRKFFDYIIEKSDGRIVVNLDATADNRTGYHYFYEYGNLFLTNRYTDWTNYYPHWTLRSLWMLSKYVPAEKFQMEFLNTWRNAKKYGLDDPLAPANIPFEYAFAVTMMAQPLAWFEGTGLPEEAFKIAPTIKAYLDHQSEIHKGTILPIGKEPNGANWTGFQSILNQKEGYVLIFREYNQKNSTNLQLCDLNGKKVKFSHICGQGKDFSAKADEEGNITFNLPAAHNFALYRYQVQ